MNLKYNYDSSIIISEFYGQSTKDTFNLNKDRTIANFSLFSNTFYLTYDNDTYLIKVKGTDREGSPREFNFKYKNGNLDDSNIEYSNIPNKTNLNFPLELVSFPSSSYFPGLLGKVCKNLAKRIDGTIFEYELNNDSLVTKIIRIDNDTIVSIVKY